MNQEERQEYTEKTTALRAERSKRLSRAKRGGALAFDAEAVLAQARERDVSGAWKIFNERRGGLLAAGCVSAFRTLLLVATLALLTVIGLGVTGRTASVARVARALPVGDYLPPEALSPRTLAAGALAGALALMAFGALLGMRRASRRRASPGPLLVVTPVGFVEYVGPRKPVRAYAFAELANITTRPPLAPSPDSPHPAHGPARVWLILHFRNGRRRRWRQRVFFGPPRHIAETILAAQAQHAAGRGSLA